MSLTIGVDVGGTKVLAGVVDEAGEILHRARRATPVGDAEALIDSIADAVDDCAQQAGEIDAVGVAIAGFIDEGRSRVLLAPNLRLRDEPLGVRLEKAVGVPIMVENDANAAAWGEVRFGAGRGSDDVVCVTVGTGVGGGIIEDGRLLRGRWGSAAEVGHMRVDPDGVLCGCGQRGCWEQYASGQALLRQARSLATSRRDDAALLLSLGDGTPEGVQGVHVTQAARRGDAVALETFASVGRWLGEGMASLAAVLDPEVFVVGGGVCEAGDLLLLPTVQAFRAVLSGGDERPVADVRLALLGNDAGLVGAADLARS